MPKLASGPHNCAETDDKVLLDVHYETLHTTQMNSI